MEPAIGITLLPHSQTTGWKGPSPSPLPVLLRGYAPELGGGSGNLCTIALPDSMVTRQPLKFWE